MISIIEESRQAKKHGFFGFFLKKAAIIPVLAVLTLAGVFYFFYPEQPAADNTAAAKVWTVSRGDIQIAIKSEGKVVAKDGVDLSFSANDYPLEVDQVFIKEGQAVKKGNRIASVKTSTLELNLRNAYASYQSVLESYNSQVAGATEAESAAAEDSVRQAELSLEQSRISLEKTKASAQASVEQSEKTLADAWADYNDNQDLQSSQEVSEKYQDLLFQIKAIEISLSDILDASDAIIGADNKTINDGFESNLSATNPPFLSKTIGTYDIAKTKTKTLTAAAIGLGRGSPYDAIDSAADLTEDVLAAYESHLFDLKTMLDYTVTGTGLTQAQLDSFKAAAAASRAGINSKQNSLSVARQAVSTARDNLADYADDYRQAGKDLAKAESDAAQDIANADANIKNRELSWAQAKRNLEDLKKPLDAAAAAAARAQLVSAATSLEKARNELEKAVIVSPIDGEVAMLNYAPGDIIVDSASAKTAATIINKNTLYIEVNIEEADINQLQVGQQAQAAFEALNGAKLNGEISFISLTSKTSANGIVTYLVRVILENTANAQIREGMTAFVDFVTAGVSAVKQIPVAAVRNIAGQPSVQRPDGAWTAVTTGFTDGKMVELISGLEEGDQLIY